MPHNVHRAHRDIIRALKTRKALKQLNQLQQLKFFAGKARASLHKPDEHLKGGRRGGFLVPPEGTASAVLMVGKEDEHLHSELKKLFCRFDKNGSGTLSLEEVKALLHRLGTVGQGAEVQQFIEMMDSDQSRSVDFKEFYIAMTATKVGDKNSHQAEIDALFETFDTGGMGTLSMQEVLKTLQSAGMKWDLHEISELFREMSPDGDEIVTKQDFTEFMLKMSTDSEHS